jgi:hypothetical protein
MEINHNQHSDKVWKQIGFFSGDDHFVFIFKKTEKIVAAIYLVTNLIKDTEPMKWELRELAVELLSASLALNRSDSVDKNASVQSILSATLELVTDIGVSRLSGLISEMNASILSREIEIIADALRERVVRDTARAGYVLSDSFFKTDESLPTPESSKSDQSGGSADKRHDKHNDRNNLVNKQTVKDKKGSRQAAILSLLGKKSGLTIKDFTNVVPGVSEKTIQRELTELVEKGVVTKEGDRRWSKYSLKIS